MKNEMLVCVSAAVLSLVTAAVCHRFFPGFGPALKPLLWPLAILGFGVRMRYAAVTAFLVPYLSYLVNGMPSPTAAAWLSVVATAFVVAMHLCRTMAIRRRPSRS